jgi:hypothetical protein
MNKRKRGRPRIKTGLIPCSRLFRVAAILSAYETERKNGQKQNSAVTDTVQLLKMLEPGIRISATEVKRTLARMWPKNAETVGHFERSMMIEEDVALTRWFREQLEPWRGKKGIILPELPSDDQVRGATKFTISIAARPSFPRHNAKTA